MAVNKSRANSELLAFYKGLPFNYQQDVGLHVENILATNQVDNYPVLAPLFKDRRTSLLEVGCGVG